MKINPIIKELLAQRGVTGDEDIEEFLSPKPVRTYDPFLLRDMEEGVDLILQNARDKKKICIYGDYDADGMTSITILMTVLQNITDNVFYYIPSRFDEGYGLNDKAVKRIHEKNTDLIVTVDCGSVAYEEVEYIKSLGMDIVVTDHHSIDNVQADCILINPKQKDCNYPFKDLAGCGVAFKLAQAIQQRAELPDSATKELLDIVAIGTVGDIVPLLDENRTLVKYGISTLNNNDRPGPNVLAQKISITRGRIGSEQIAFGIVPHLNAAGRMSVADAGVELLMASDEDEAALSADKLVEYNNRRKSTQDATYEDCLKILKEKHDGDLFPIIRDENAHEGIVGIVAGKLKEDIGRPVSIVTPGPEEGMLKGTGRSIPEVNLYDLMKTHEELFERFGGHSGACGYVIKEENLEELRHAMNDEVQKLTEKNPALFDNASKVDMYIAGKDLTMDFVKELEQMEPFGSGNTRPRFAIPEAILSNQYTMGPKGNHMRFKANFGEGSSVDCVLFGKAEEYKDIVHSKKALTLKGTVSINRWKETEKIQFITDAIGEEK